MHKNFHKVFISGEKITVIAKSAKTHPAAEKCCGWEEHAICATVRTKYCSVVNEIFLRFL